MSVDMRTRSINAVGPDDPDTFFQGSWREAVGRNGGRAAADADRLALPPIAIEVDDDSWTLRPGEQVIDVATGPSKVAHHVRLDGKAFADWICERRTALGLVVAGRVQGDADSNNAFCAWDPVVRSLLDARPVYEPGAITLRSASGSDLDLDQKFSLVDPSSGAAQFLAEAGFLVLRNMFTEAEMDSVDAELSQAVEAARPDDGESWWATTSAGERYPCRILEFARKSDALRALIGTDRYAAIGNLLGDGHQPGDPFGEHFADVTAEGLVKRVGSVDGLVCLPWHKDCDRGGHSMFCSGLTVGICLTPVDVAHGGLDVVAGSHRANIARAQIDSDLELPQIRLQAGRGDVTVHMSCTLHRSTHPTSRERHVAYSGFALPPRPGDAHEREAQPVLRRERAEIGESSHRRMALGTEVGR